VIGINKPYHISITSTQVLTYHEIGESELWSKMYGCEYDKNVSHGIFMAGRNLTNLQNLYASNQIIDVEGAHLRRYINDSKYVKTLCIHFGPSGIFSWNTSCFKPGRIEIDF
jgi:hypothetical protein